MIHTKNHTTSSHLSSSPEQGTSSFERNPTFEKKNENTDNITTEKT